MNWDMIPSLLISIAAIAALLWLFARWERRTERRIAELSRDMRLKHTGTKDADGGDDASRLDEMAQRLEEMHRRHETLERTVADTEMRMSKLGPDADGDAARSLASIKEKLPLLEEALTDFGEICAELTGGVQRLNEQRKALGEKCDEEKNPEETRNILRQTKALLHNGGKSIETAAEALKKVSGNVARFVEFLAGLYKVCELCNKNAPDVSVCLKCGRKYCDDCKGRKIGHCKDCASTYAPLHLDIGEE